jgi:hypothetical protein
MRQHLFDQILRKQVVEYTGRYRVSRSAISPRSFLVVPLVLQRVRALPGRVRLAALSPIP